VWRAMRVDVNRSLKSGGGRGQTRVVSG